MRAIVRTAYGASDVLCFGETALVPYGIHLMRTGATRRVMARTPVTIGGASRGAVGVSLTRPRRTRRDRTPILREFGVSGLAQGLPSETISGRAGGHAGRYHADQRGKFRATERFLASSTSGTTVAPVSHRRE